VLLRGTARSFLGLRDIPQAVALSAIKALDTDGSGKAEKNEVEAFARLQGVSAEQISHEFEELDTNRDGALEADEIGSGLASPPAPAQKPSVPQAAGTDASAQTSSTSVDASPATLKVDPATAATAVIGSTSHSVSAAVGHFPQGNVTLNKAIDRASLLVAEAFAGSASASFEHHQADEAQAQNLTILAKSLRDKAALVASTAQEQVQAAAKHAAAAVLEAHAPKVLQMEQQVKDLTADAQQHRQKAKEATAKIMVARDNLK